jgi:predicted nucleotidyltransferase
MSIPIDYPGTAQQQALLGAIVSFYAHDPRVMAVAVFGSLGRGNWDAYSDLDLDVVVADEVRIDIRQELAALCASFSVIGERALLIVFDGDESADVVLESLLEFSIRYHPLCTTNPNIVDSLLVLSGTVDRTAIQAAGEANRRVDDRRQLAQLLDRCVRYAVGADVALQRGGIWSAVELLHLMRDLLMALFASTHGYVRTYQAFQAHAEPALQARLGSTLPRYDLSSAQASLAGLLDLLETGLDELSSGCAQLNENQRKVLRQVRARQARLAQPHDAD